MEHDGRLLRLEDDVHARGVAHVGDLRHDLDARALAQLAIDLEEVVLGVVDHHEPADLHAQQLAAELGSDRAARAGHQYRATAHVGADGGGVELNGLAPEDVLHLHGAQLGDEVVVAVDEVVHVRQRLDGHSGRAAGRDHLGAFAAAGRRHGDVHLVGLARLEDLGQVVRRPDHLDALEAVAQLVGVVVDERDRRVARQPVAEHLAQDQVAGVTGADDQHLLALSDERAPPRALDQRAGENARAAQQDQREDQVQHQRALRGRALARRAGEKALGDRVLLELRHAMRRPAGRSRRPSAAFAGPSTPRGGRSRRAGTSRPRARSAARSRRCRSPAAGP